MRDDPEQIHGHREGSLICYELFRACCTQSTASPKFLNPTFGSTVRDKQTTTVGKLSTAMTPRGSTAMTTLQTLSFDPKCRPQARAARWSSLLSPEIRSRYWLPRRMWHCGRPPQDFGHSGDGVNGGVIGYKEGIS